MAHDRTHKTHHTHDTTVSEAELKERRIHRHALEGAHARLTRLSTDFSGAVPPWFPDENAFKELYRDAKDDAERAEDEGDE